MNRTLLAILTTVALLLGTTIVAFADDSPGTGTVGAVYTMTNAADGNQIVVFDRKPDGRLTLSGAIPTGGSGSGPGPVPAPVRLATAWIHWNPRTRSCSPATTGGCWL